MLQSNRPNKYLAPFAVNDASKVDIPLTTSDATRASQSLGFPPLTGTPPEAGGVPPQRQDFNGAMNQVARVPWWVALGGRFPFDLGFATDPAINGYPGASVLPSANTLGEWYSLVDNNTANPDTSGADWVPGYHYGKLELTGQTGGTLTLPPSQAAKRYIVITGTLTSDLTLVMPNWVYAWDVVNNTGGAFTVTVKTAAAGGAVVAQNGQPSRLIGDGSNILLAVPTISAATTTAAGVVRLATAPEAAAVTSQTIAVTPLGLAQTKQISWITGLQVALDGKANLAGATFTGDITSAGTITSGERFVSSSVNVVLGTTGAGTVLFRPNGAGSGVGEARINSAGELTTAGSITAGGGFQNGSSRTVKDHVSYIDPAQALQNVLALRGITYRYHGSDDVRAGYYAEEVREVRPEAVSDGDAGSFSPLLLEDAQMLPDHTGAIQELYRMILELQEKTK